MNTGCDRVNRETMIYWFIINGFTQAKRPTSLKKLRCRDTLISETCLFFTTYKCRVMSALWCLATELMNSSVTLPMKPCASMRPATSYYLHKTMQENPVESACGPPQCAIWFHELQQFRGVRHTADEEERKKKKKSLFKRSTFSFTML